MLLESVKPGSLCISWHIPSMKVIHFTAEFVFKTVLKRVSDDVSDLSIDVLTLSDGNAYVTMVGCTCISHYEHI